MRFPGESTVGGASSPSAAEGRGSIPAPRASRGTSSRWESYGSQTAGGLGSTPGPALRGVGQEARQPDSNPATGGSSPPPLTPYAGSSVGRAPAYGRTGSQNAASTTCAGCREVVAAEGEAQDRGRGVASHKPGSVDMLEDGGSSPSPRTFDRHWVKSPLQGGPDDRLREDERGTRPFGWRATGGQLPAPNGGPGGTPNRGSDGPAVEGPRGPGSFHDERHQSGRCPGRNQENDPRSRDESPGLCRPSEVGERCPGDSSRVAGPKDGGVVGEPSGANRGVPDQQDSPRQSGGRVLRGTEASSSSPHSDQSVARWRWPKFVLGQRLGDPKKPYLRRWVIDFGACSFRLHHWMSSDDLRAPHDHAWDFASMLFKGTLIDRVPGDTGGYVEADPTSWRDIPRQLFIPEFFSAEHRHSVVAGPLGAWTLMFCGPERRNWGFWTPRKGGRDKGTVRFRNRNKYFRTHGHH